MIEEKESEFISLQEATKYCHYSQEYLSLRARQGKLKAIKFGRNWVIKKEWLTEYLEKIKENNEKINRTHKEAVCVSIKIKKQKFVAPPENLPLAPTPIMLQWKYGFLIGLGVVLLISGFVFGKEFFYPVAIKGYENMVSHAYIIANISKSGGEVIKDYFSWLKETLTSIPQKVYLIITQTEIKELKAGNPEKPDGITIYDEITGQAYCIKTRSGQIVSLVGECGRNQSLIETTTD